MGPITRLNRRHRIIWLFFGALLAWVVLLGRIAWLQVVRGDELRQRALATRLRDVPVEAKRGVITDREGRELAVSLEVDSFYAIPSRVRDPERTAGLLAPLLGKDEAEVLSLLTKQSAFVWLKRKVDDGTSQQIRALKLPGIESTPESRRVYPKGTLAAHVLGIAGVDSQGLEGLEKQYEKELRGTPGRIVVEYDARGEEIPNAMHRYFPATDGNTLVLTLDEGIQFIFERELDRVMLKTGARQAIAIAMDPHTGEILALVQRPTFDPNDWSRVPAEVRRLSAISDSYAPGSTFKPLTVAAALEEGVIDWNDRFYCGGSTVVSGRRISCWKETGHGSQTLTEAIYNSCNVALITIGLHRLGADRFYKYLDAFGITERTGVDFPGEAAAIIPARRSVKPVDLAVMSFGQTLTMTPLQLVRAVATIANGGRLVEPHLVREVRRPDGTPLWTYASETPRQVLSQDTARELARALQGVVEEGTGRWAWVPGYAVGGKTGTAQKVVDGRVSTDKHIASFVGLAPVDDPRVVVLVLVDEPKGTQYGGQIAAPVMGYALRDVLRYMGIPARPELMKPPKSLLAFGGSPYGAEARVPSDEEAPPAAPPEGSLVAVPSVIGQSMAQAGQLLASVGLKLAPSGSGLAATQEPAPGVRVRRGSSIRVQFLPPPR